MKTILINGRFLTQQMTGVQRYARDMAAALQGLKRPDFRFVLAVPDGKRRSPFPDMEIIEDRSRLRGMWWEQLRLPRLMRKIGASLLWNPCNTGPVAVSRQVVTIHDASVFAGSGWFSAPFRVYYRLLQPALGRRAAAIVTDSQFSKDELVRCRIAPLQKISVVPPMVSPLFQAVDAQAAAKGGMPPFVLCIASRNPRKNVKGLIRAWTLLPESVKAGTELVIAGGHSPAHAKDPLDAIPRDVRLLGYVSDEKLAELYRQARAFLFPSLYEGFGLPPLEAMACGTPVLASHIAPLKESCGESVLYCDPSSPSSIAEGISRLLTDEALRKDLAARGPERAAAFQQGRSAHELAQLFAALTNVN